MPKGSKDIHEFGKKTQFNGESAVEAQKKSAEAKRRKKCLRDIAHAALYEKPPIGRDRIKQVADYYGVTVDDITIADIAIFMQVVEAVKGDRAAFEMIANYAGEKPAEKVMIAEVEQSVIDEVERAILEE